MSVTPITVPPVLVDATAYQYFFTGNFFCGPWLVGSDLYAALAIIGGLDVRIEVVKSTDNGSTWNRQEDGNGSSISANGIIPLFTALQILWFFGAVNPIDVFDADYTDEQDFTFSGDSFGALNSDNSTTYVGAMRAGFRSDASVLVAYASGASLVEGRIFSGSWAAPFTIDATATGGSYALLVDASDVGHVLFLVGGSIDYRTVTGAGTVSGSVTIPDIIEPTDQAVADSGSLYLPFIQTSGLHARAILEVATGATSNPATASWSQYPVWSGTLDATSEDSSSFAILDGSDLLVFWINTTALGIARVYSARFNGSGFDSPVLFYDSSLYPPAGSTQNPTMRGLSVVNLAGTFVGIVAMDIDGSGNQTFYLSGGAPTFSGYRNRVY